MPVQAWLLEIVCGLAQTKSNVGTRVHPRHCFVLHCFLMVVNQSSIQCLPYGVDQLSINRLLCAMPACHP
jgi:hypothetical protein